MRMFIYLVLTLQSICKHDPSCSLIAVGYSEYTPYCRYSANSRTINFSYKLHRSSRPISMKSDIIRKRHRSNARRLALEAPSVSPDVSQCPSPARAVFPILAPDSTITWMSYDHKDNDYRSSQSELMGALGHGNHPHHMHNFQHAFTPQFPGPYHPDHMTQIYNPSTDPLLFASIDSSDMESIVMSPHMQKWQRMSTESMSETPSSMVSYGLYTDGYLTPASSATYHSQRSPMESPFSSHPPMPCDNGGPVFHSYNNIFWHLLMMPQGQNSSHLFPLLMLPPSPIFPNDYSGHDLYNTNMHMY
jgi:hypothetical protein